MGPAFQLSEAQRDTFDRRGVVRLPKFYPEADIAGMADRLWADLEARYGMRRDRPESWTVALPAQFQALVRSGAFAALGSLALIDLADELLGPGRWEAPRHWGRALVTFPTPAPVLARPPWHLDLSGAERLDPLPILRVFTFLEPVAPGQGGTLFVAGSHQLARQIEAEAAGPVRSAQVRDRLAAEHPWFATLVATATADLPAMMGQEAQIEGHGVRLEEMTGDPGDLILMHPAILHAAGHNGRDRPRLMLTEWISRRPG